jgi:putative ABC transport system permease protein
MLGDLRLALRQLRKQPGFSIAAVLALAIGIGSNTAIFSVIHNVLLAPLPYPSPDRLVVMWESQPTLNRCSVSAPDLRDWKTQSQSFEGIAGFVNDRFGVSAPMGTQHFSGALTSPEFFHVLGVSATQGRTYDESDRQGCVAVISAKAAPKLGQDTPVIGRSVTIDQKPCTIIGVVAAESAYPSRTDLWVRSEHELPIMRGSSPDVLSQRGSHYMQLVGRLKPGVTPEQAEKELGVISDRLAASFPDTNVGHRAQLAPMQEDLVRGIRPTLLALLGSVLFVLLIASANVASLQLARATVREHELVTRAALGATRGRLLRQLLIENVALALIGAGAGLVVALWGIEGLAALGRNLPATHKTAIDLPVLGFTIGVAVVTGLAFGILPALNGSAVPVAQVLSGHGRVAGGKGRARQLLVATEIALALALATGAGVLMRSFSALSSVQPGFQAEGVVVLPVTPPPAKLTDDATLAAWENQLLEAIAAAPGVQHAGAILNLPMNGSNTNSDFIIDGQARPEKNDRWVTEQQAVSPDYFETMGIPLLSGRRFDGRDTLKSQKVILINRALAKQYFPGQNPIGKRLSIDTGDHPDWLEIVGVVGDVHQNDLIQPTRPEIYWPLAQNPPPWMSIVVRGEHGFEANLRRAVLAFDPQLPAEELEPLSMLVTRSLAQRRFAMLLWGIFAAMALLLVLVGVYGVMSYTVAQRTREIGIRMALGADPRRVIRLVLREGFQVAGLGLVFGALGAFAVSRVIAQFVYGVSAMDPLTLFGVAALVVGVALTACVVPARRSSRVDPMAALRSD